MPQRVILYGFGWVGQSMLALCEALGIECRIIDDGIDKSSISDKRLVGFEILQEPFALCLITVHCQENAQKILAKLEAKGIDSCRVRHICCYDYRPSMSYLLPHFFTAQSLLDLLQSDDFALPHFSAMLADIVALHRQNRAKQTPALLRKEIDARFPRQSVFAKIFARTPINRELRHIPYPGFNAVFSASNASAADDNFCFEALDWESVRNRPKDTNLIACFGNSALRLSYLPLQETLTGCLRQELQKYTKCIVLNFGVIGYTIYEQMMLYNALIYALAPEIVVSFFGGTDWRTGSVSDEVLLKDHKINYTPGYYEYQAKTLAQACLPLMLNATPLYTELEIPNPKISDTDVNAAITTRLRQFHDIVCGGGGGQICCLYPAAFAMQESLDARGEGYAA